MKGSAREQKSEYQISDETWYRQYLDGNEKAAEELVSKYGDLLVWYIHGYVKDFQEAEDLMIEAFSRMFAKERPLRQEGSFRAYLYKIARNLSLRHIGKPGLVLLPLQSLTFEPVSERLTDTEIFEKERNRQLYDALSKLRAEYREVLYLTYFENMSYKEAAVIMKKSEQQITNLVHRGKQNLKEVLEQEGFHYENK